MRVEMDDETWTALHTRSHDLFYCRVSENDWFGTVESRFPESFLHHVDRYAVRFKLRDHEWEVAYECNGKGVVRVYCCACEPHYEAEVQWAHTFVNHSHPDYNILSGGLMVWKEQGERKQMCLSQWTTTIEHPGLRFLDHRGFITVQMECRLVSIENELCITVTNERPHHYIWRLKNLCSMSPKCIVSDVFELNDYLWCLKLCPRGHSGVGSQMLVDVVSMNNTPVHALVACAVLNTHSAADGQYHELRHFFHDHQPSAGWSDILPYACLEREDLGFVKDGWFTCILQISIEDNDSFESEMHSTTNRSSRMPLQRSMRSRYSLEGMASFASSS